MKRFAVVLLALGLICAFAMPAGATDMKVSGTYYVQGTYSANSALASDTDATSHAWYHQRLRVATVFQVNKALSVSTRFDAMEGYWGGANFIYDHNGNIVQGGKGVRDTWAADEANIDWEYVYMTFMTKCGKFDIGIMSDGVYGTTFGNTEVWLPKIGWGVPIGKFYNLFQYKKWGENDTPRAVNPVGNALPFAGSDSFESDSDYDRYMDILFYFAKTWQAGFLYQYNRDAGFSGAAASLVPPNAGGYKTTFHVFIPYVKATIGNLYVESELSYITGDLRDWEEGVAANDVDMKGLAFYVLGKYTIGAGYLGAQFAYTKGNDITDPTEVYISSGGDDYDPCLILWNDEYDDWAPTNLGAASPSTGTNGAMSNGFLYQIFGGFSPMKNLDLYASLTYAKADEPVVANQVDDDYGMEFDVKATYRIFDNLEYMVGFGYFWAGDYYKGANAAYEMDDEYLLLHRLTVKF